MAHVEKKHGITMAPCPESSFYVIFLRHYNIKKSNLIKLQYNDKEYNKQKIYKNIIFSHFTPK